MVAGTTKVVVKESIESVWKGEMTPETLTLEVGKTGRVVAKQISEVTVDTLPTYKSSDTSVAKVDREGNVVARFAPNEKPESFKNRVIEELNK